MTVHKTQSFHTLDEVNDFKCTLSEQEKEWFSQLWCQSHQPTLVCIVNESGSVKKDFCEKDLNGQNPISAFSHWIVNTIVKPTNVSKSDKNDYVFVAHNGSAYDTQFMYQMAHHMFNHTNVQPLIHMNCMIKLCVLIHTPIRVVSIFFKDSYKFINLSLRSLPKSFGFLNTLQKGFFPHLLNTKENFNFTCVGLPDRDCFCPNEMDQEELSHFETWYQIENARLLSAHLENGDLYDLRCEMKKYCYDDCHVLATAFARFNGSMINELLRDDVNDIVPHQYTILADFITLPQLVIHWYVATSMPEHTLAIVPHGGYDKGKCGSLKENIWLGYLDRVHERDEGMNFVPIRSHYCTSGSQKRVGHYHLDSFHALTDGHREYYEFYGCYYHGCMSCYPDRSHLVRKQVREDGYHSIQAAFDSTME